MLEYRKHGDQIGYPTRFLMVSHRDQQVRHLMRRFPREHHGMQSATQHLLEARGLGECGRKQSYGLRAHMA